MGSMDRGLCLLMGMIWTENLVGGLPRITSPNISLYQV